MFGNTAWIFGRFLSDRERQVMEGAIAHTEYAKSMGMRLCDGHPFRDTPPPAEEVEALNIRLPTWLRPPSLEQPKLTDAQIKEVEESLRAKWGLPKSTES